MGIEGWLEALGLERYAAAFRDNDVDLEILPDLTADDLRDLGVASVGHRRRLLQAIAALQPPDAARADGTPAPIARPEAERRRLTVLFCDLVSSTTLAAQLDPEDLREVIGAYQNAIACEVARYEGHVAKYMGDGVLAYFGYPKAHEDDAERAVRAGLAMVESAAGLKTPAGESLAARVGIATGLVVVGDLIGEGAAQEQAVVGETPSLAARLQTLAGPGSVVISQATRRLLGGLFELDDLGPQRLRGFAEPLAAFRVVGEGRAEGRFEALRGAQLTPLIGREHELAILLERWSWAKDGDGQVVLIAGEPGIGKSRLVRALRQELAGESHLALSHFCSPYHTNSALHPVIAQLERAAALAADDAPEARLEKLETLLRQATDRLDQALPLLAALLGISPGERYPPLNLSPQRQKQRTLEVLIEQLAGLARERPVLEAYEDVHWVDPSTLELLDLLVEQVRSMRALVVLTYRPEFVPPWSGHAHVTALPLNRLGRRQGAAMVDRVTGGKTLPGEVMDQILAKTDGVPLFVEELTKAVLELGLLRPSDDGYEIAGPLPPLAIPANLHDSLMARLDRLATVKELAQIGAVIGREFPHELLAAVADRPEEQLKTNLDQLVASELVFRRGTPPEATYSFKHALVQDAAYGTLLKSRRRQLHARIAEVLEKQFPETADAQPELLAHHYSQAGLVERSAKNWERAGQNAVGRFAMAEAVAHLTSALEQIASMPDAQDRSRTELRLQLLLGGALLATRGWASVEMGKAYDRARQLSRQVGDSFQLLPALWGMFIFHHNSGEIRAGYKVANELLELAEKQREPVFRSSAHRCVGVSLLFQARFDLARSHFNRFLSNYDRTTQGLPLLFPHDARVAACSFLSWILLFEGHPDRALVQSQMALSEAREVSQPFTLAFALHVNCVFHQVLGNFTVVEERSAELIVLAAEHRFRAMLGTGTFF